MPGVPAGPLSAPAPKPLPVNAVAIDRVAGAAAAQLCGADNPPTKVARPIPADTPPLRAADAAPPPRPDPGAGRTPLAGFASAGSKCRVKSESVISTFLIDEIEVLVSWLASKSPKSKKSPKEVNDGGSAAAAGDASPRSAVVIAEIIDCALVAADVPLAWATAAPCAACPAGLVFWAGAVNGVSVDALAEEAA
jgi:hypothetical protein